MDNVCRVSRTKSKPMQTNRKRILCVQDNTTYIILSKSEKLRNKQKTVALQ